IRRSRPVAPRSAIIARRRANSAISSTRSRSTTEKTKNARPAVAAASSDASSRMGARRSGARSARNDRAGAADAATPLSLLKKRALAIVGAGPIGLSEGERRRFCRGFDEGRGKGCFRQFSDEKIFLDGHAGIQPGLDPLPESANFFGRFAAGCVFVDRKTRAQRVLMIVAHHDEGPGDYAGEIERGFVGERGGCVAKTLSANRRLVEDE